MKPSTLREPAAGRYPAIAAVAFIAIVAGSLWWSSRDDPPTLVPGGEVAVSVPVSEPVAKPPEPRPAVVAYLSFAEAPSPEELPLDHGYASEGLRLLAAAVAVEGGSPLWRDRAKRLRTAADKLQADPDSLRHADIARQAFILAAEWLADLRVPTGEAGPAATRAHLLMKAAEEIHADEPMRAQKERVDRFFDLAAALLSTASDRSDRNA